MTGQNRNETVAIQYCIKFMIAHLNLFNVYLHVRNNSKQVPHQNVNFTHTSQLKSVFLFGILSTACARQMYRAFATSGHRSKLYGKGRSKTPTRTSKRVKGCHLNFFP